MMSASLTYELCFVPAQHTIRVHLALADFLEHEIVLMMPVWTPGSYMIREYARHVETLNAYDSYGHALSVRKTHKNRWLLITEQKSPIYIDYQIYAREMSVRTNWVGDDFALVNGAATFMTVLGQEHLVHHVRVMPPAPWPHVYTALPQDTSHPPQHAVYDFYAADFDTLVDSPILCCAAEDETFAVGDVEHTLVTLAADSTWDKKRAVSDVQKLVETHQQLFGHLPYSRYLLMNLFTGTYGGLEHHNSCVLMSQPKVMQKRQSYVAWLGLVSHELFHAWNGKRLRPIELGPFDYERENTTRSLWIAEGFTAYYDDLQVRRAHLISVSEYLQILGKHLEDLQRAEGRHVQSLSDASFDAWIKFYRHHENSHNTTISYYLKGAVLAFVLDAKIRHATLDARNLDDVMRQAYGLYSGQQGYTEALFRSTISDVAGVDLALWLCDMVDKPGELLWQEALDYFGLAFVQEARLADDLATHLGLGLKTKLQHERLLVSEVTHGYAAHAAGLQVDDEILAVDNQRVVPIGLSGSLSGSLSASLAGRMVGQQAIFCVSRNERLQEAVVVFVPGPVALGRLEIHPQATLVQTKRLQAWLHA